MVEACRNLLVHPRRHETDGDYAHNVAGHGKRHRTQEQEPPPNPRRLVEIRISRSKRHQGEERPQPGTRLRHIYGEGSRSAGNDGRPLPYGIIAKAIKRHHRHAAREIPQVDGHDVKERGKRNAKQEESRREYEELRESPSEERPRQSNAQAYEPEFLQPELHSTGAKQRQTEERQTRRQSDP